MIKVLHLLPSFQVGGTETQLYRVSSHMPKDKVCQRVLAFRDGPLSRMFQEAGMDVSILGMGPMGLARLFLELWKYRPDVLHTHLYPCNQVGRCVGLFFPGCLVLSADRCVDVYTGPLYGFLDRLTIHWGVGTLVNSQSVKTFLVLTRRLPVDRIRVIENGVKMVSRIGRVRKENGKVLRLLCVARLAPQKGVHILLRALASPSVRSTPWNLKVVGEGTHRPYLVKLSQELKIADRVLWLGEIRDWSHPAAESDLLVLPSFFEGLPNVLIEAMARGLPVIASDVGGSSDVVQPDLTGWLVESGNVAGLSRAILQAQDSDLETLGNNAMDRVLRFFCLDRTVERTLDVYEEICLRRKRSVD